MINIPAKIYSDAIWKTIRYRTKEEEIPHKLARESGQDATISEYTSFMLFRLAWLFRPKVVVEIGTYIGRSTLAMAQGMASGVIYTCDSGNDECKVDNTPNVLILKHSNTMSTDMLQNIGEKADLFFFDGRIQPADVDHIARLSKPDTVYLFDDFEGVEKGVANALMIQHLGGILVYPEAGQTLGMMIRKVGFTRQ